TVGADQVALNALVAGTVGQPAAEHIAAHNPEVVRQLGPAIPNLLDHKAPVTQRWLGRQAGLVFFQPPYRHEPVQDLSGLAVVQFNARIWPSAKHIDSDSDSHRHSPCRCNMSGPAVS